MRLAPALCLLLVSFAPLSHAAPELTPRARLKTHFAYLEDDAGATSRFDLDSLELGLLATWGETFRLDAQFDATRSSSPESLFGIDGNSIVFIARRALGALTLPLGPGDLTLSLGLLPDPVISSIENLDLRAIDDALADTGRFLPRSDLGASLRYDLGRLALTLAVTHGEGARDVERDTQKDFIAMIEATPLTFEALDETAELTLLVTGRTGSRGVGSVPHDHVGASLALVHPRLILALEAHLAWGHEGRQVDAMGLSAVSALTLYRGLSLTARHDWLDLDLDLDESSSRTLDLGLLLSIGRLFGALDPELAALGDSLKLRLAWRHHSTDAAIAPTPGLASSGDADTFVLTLEARTW